MEIFKNSILDVGLKGKSRVSESIGTRMDVIRVIFVKTRDMDLAKCAGVMEDITKDSGKTVCFMVEGFLYRVSIILFMFALRG